MNQLDPPPLGAWEGLRYGLLGLPLAFCALPLYVLMPNLYAREWGVSLAGLGAVLMAARLLDAAIDPLLGRWSDHLYRKSLKAVLVMGAVAAAVLWLAFALLFEPPLRDSVALLWWAGLWLAVTYTAYSALAVAHQAWGAKLGGSAVFRSRVVAWREGLGLLGVVLAAVSAAALGVVVMLALLGLGLGAGWWAWSHAPRPVMPDAFTAVHPMRTVAWWHPWRNRSFRRLMVVFLLNGIASSIPATLVLFFVQDRLQAGVAWQPAVLGIYFLCGALSIPLWLKGVCQLGLERTWLLGMVLSVIVFLGASLLGTGDELPFLAVCALSGAALGSDLAVPAALLAGVIANAGDNGHAEGAYFGWWNFAAKFNLALAAGLALPLLSWLGYAPGARDAEVLRVLTVAYCLLPCLLKVLSAAALYFLLIQPAVRPPIP